MVVGEAVSGAGSRDGAEVCGVSAEVDSIGRANPGAGRTGTVDVVIVECCESGDVDDTAGPSLECDGAVEIGVLLG